MTPKQYLMQLPRLAQMIRQRQIQIEELRALMEGMGGFDYSKPMVKSSPPPEPPYVELVSQLTETEEHVRSLIRAYTAKQNEIIGRIERVPDERYQRLLCLRYVQGRSLQQIADEMMYEYDWTRALHGRALETFGEINRDALE